MIVTQIIGWIGAIAYVLAYLLLSLEILKSDQELFHSLNTFGAICLVINALPVNDYPTIAVNTVWGLIGVVSIIRIIRKRKYVV
ncbi:hypothetical protein [uncultured Aquimarina sp.]|uniref:CBU_0592 family membrane protein n=1 Tax=uncultured Aquimarina sp. TaxID=575652 RepID=UPI002601D33B|nr:hypothetical protein [uncultured Aquimarina sp.]